MLTKLLIILYIPDRLGGLDGPGRLGGVGGPGRPGGPVKPGGPDKLNTQVFAIKILLVNVKLLEF